MSSSNLIKWLFETNAVRVCPDNKPFWYTSGTIGPYYINTHFLYGSENKANELLQFIDSAKNDILTCPDKILEIVINNYNTNEIYKNLINNMIEFIKLNIDVSSVDYISGGERRDWFFSLLIAKLLDKPHITIYKDLSCVVTIDSKTQAVPHIKGNVLHIADLITEASSYERTWIPAIKSLGAQIKWSVVVVDRKQGGEELLLKHGIKSYSMVDIDRSLFDHSLEIGLITPSQHDMISNYIDNPKSSMRSFLMLHPEFLNNSLNADDKTSERAKLCINNNIYNLE
jgi:orotate phosphoribosyltransferase